MKPGQRKLKTGAGSSGCIRKVPAMPDATTTPRHRGKGNETHVGTPSHSVAASSRIQVSGSIVDRDRRPLGGLGTLSTVVQLADQNPLPPLFGWLGRASHKRHARSLSLFGVVISLNETLFHRVYPCRSSYVARCAASWRSSSRGSSSLDLGTRKPGW